MVFTSVVMLLRIKPDKIINENGEEVDDYMRAFKSIGSSIIYQVQNYDRKNIPSGIMQQIRDK